MRIVPFDSDALYDMTYFIDRISEGGNAIASVCPSVRLFPLYFRNRLTVDPERLRVSRPTTTACTCRVLKVKVKVMGQANAVGPTSVEGS